MNDNRKQIDDEFDMIIEDTENLSETDDEKLDVDEIFIVDFYEELANNSVDDLETTASLSDEYFELDDFENPAVSNDNSVFDISLGSELLDDDSGEADSSDDDEILDFDSSWFVAETDDSTEDDGGIEGLLHAETYDIDENNWAAMEQEEDEVLNDDILEVLKRNDLLLNDYDNDEADFNDCLELNVKTSFLGPASGALFTAVFYQGTPLGVGERIYVLEGDSLFHPVSESCTTDFTALNVAWYKDEIYIGTKDRGALVTRDLGRTFSSINSWYTSGFVRGGEVCTDKCSTSFSIMGHFHPTHFRLLGCTGEGQIYATYDGGKTWEGPLLKGCCIETSACTGDPTVWALTKDISDSISLQKSQDLVNWESVPIPLKISSALIAAKTSIGMASGRKSIALYSRGTGGYLYLSTDDGNNWQEIRLPFPITAVVMDSENPNTIVAATTHSNGRSKVVVSFDCGLSFLPVLSVYSDAEPGKNTVSSLAINYQNGTHILATTQNGAYLIMLPNDNVKH